MAVGTYEYGPATGEIIARDREIRLLKEHILDLEQDVEEQKAIAQKERKANGDHLRNRAQRIADEINAATEPLYERIRELESR